jgi:uncharacterized protein
VTSLAVRIAIDIDSTLHHHWPLVAAAAKRRFGVDLPYEQQFLWAARRLDDEQLRRCIEDSHSDEAIGGARRWLHDIGLRHDDLYCGDEVAHCRRMGIELLIDDSPGNLLHALEAGMCAATLLHPWSEDVRDASHVISAADWQELARVLEPLLAPLERGPRAPEHVRADTLARHVPKGRGEMPDLLDRITQDIQRRLDELRPLAREAERLEAALQALGADTATSPPSAAPAAPTPASPRAQPARRRRTRQARQPVATPASAPAATRSRPRAPRGQNRERVLGVVRERPGATTAEIASVSGVQRTVVHGVLRKLESNGEVKSQDLPSGTKGWAIQTNDKPARSRTAPRAASAQADTQPRQDSVPATSATADANENSTKSTGEKAGEPSAS